MPTTSFQSHDWLWTCRKAGFIGEQAGLQCRSRISARLSMYQIQVASIVCPHVRDTYAYLQEPREYETVGSPARPYRAPPPRMILKKERNGQTSRIERRFGLQTYAAVVTRNPNRGGLLSVYTWPYAYRRLARSRRPAVNCMRLR